MKQIPNSRQVWVIERIWTEADDGGVSLRIAAKPDHIPAGDFIGTLNERPGIHVPFREMGIINQERVFQANSVHLECAPDQMSQRPTRLLVTRLPGLSR